MNDPWREYRCVCKPGRKREGGRYRGDALIRSAEDDGRAAREQRNRERRTRRVESSSDMAQRKAPMDPSARVYVCVCVSERERERFEVRSEEREGYLGFVS